MVTTPAVSLVLTSQDRQQDLDRFFHSILSQKCDCFIELIFVNQGVYNPLHGFVLPPFLSYKLISVGHRMPLSAARNLGLESVTGSIVGFPDDDCWYEPNLIDKVVEFFRQSVNVACLCTNVYDPDRGTTYGKRPVGEHAPVFYNNLFKLPISVGIFCKLAVLDKIGRKFDERLGAGTLFGSGEETELISRFLTAHFIVEYRGDIQVYHPVADYVETDPGKYYLYGLGFGFVNGWLLRKRHIQVLPYFLEMLFRSLLGMLINVRSHVKRETYARRLYGILIGCIKGIGND